MGSKETIATCGSSNRNLSWTHLTQLWTLWGPWLAWTTTEEDDQVFQLREHINATKDMRGLKGVWVHQVGQRKGFEAKGVLDPVVIQFGGFKGLEHHRGTARNAD